MRILSCMIASRIAPVPAAAAASSLQSASAPAAAPMGPGARARSSRCERLSALALVLSMVVLAGTVTHVAWRDLEPEVGPVGEAAAAPDAGPAGLRRAASRPPVVPSPPASEPRPSRDPHAVLVEI